MINNDPFHLLFIEPKNPPSKEPVIDEYVETMEKAISEALIPNSWYWWRGTHECTGCKDHIVRSTNFDLILPTGLITNSLAIHYLKYHRDEVHEFQLKHIDILAEHFIQRDNIGGVFRRFDEMKDQFEQCMTL